MYSGALFIQQSVGWDLYVSILFLLGMTALCTVSGMFEKRMLVFILELLGKYRLKELQDASFYYLISMLNSDFYIVFFAINLD